MQARLAACVFSLLAAGASCSGTEALSHDAGTEGAVQPSHFCDGLPGLPGDGVALEAPFVTFQDDAGPACVLRLGERMADSRVCGDVGPSALIEAACPSTSVVFALWGGGGTVRAPELYVQGGYAFTRMAGQRLRNGRVLEVAIDSTTGNVVTGHFQIELEALNPGPATRASGTFRLCATIGASIEPCRNP